MAFVQSAPRLANQYTDDSLLRSWLSRHVPEELLREFEPGFREMGELAAGRLHALDVEHRLDEPKHIAWDAWGNRIDLVQVNGAWREYAALAAHSGLVAIPYERAHGEHSRVEQFTLVYLFAPSTQAYACPLAMTDGCARTLSTLAAGPLRERVLPRLISRDPARAWTSGQWMTERIGGSDVGANQTVARQVDGVWRLYGTKWFTSAVSSDVALVLARPEGNPGGGKGLALFLVELRDASGRLQGITLNRLKDKLGTRYLPTAELTLEGAPAEPVAGLAEGVKHMAPMLNVTRSWNAVWAVSLMRRALALVRDYARRRHAFGAPLAQKPLFLDTLAGMAAEYEAGFQLAFHVVTLLGREEARPSAAESGLGRVLLPLAKLLTAKQAVGMIGEAVECFGGAGYVEDTGLPALLRDAHVLPIWEGTTDVLSLEVYRALDREQNLGALLELVRASAARARAAALVPAANAACTTIERAARFHADHAGRDPECFEAGARAFALSVARAVALALCIEHAQWRIDHEQSSTSAFAARRVMEHGVDLLRAQPSSDERAALALG